MKREEFAIALYPEVGAFAEDKDKARDIRISKILPKLKEGHAVILDFKKIDSTTQSFIHALISDVIRIEGVDVLDRLLFKNCNEVVRAVIEIVIDYVQEPPKYVSNGNGHGKKR